MADFDFYLGGTDEQTTAVGNGAGLTVVEGVIDVADIVANGYNTTDVLRLVEVEAGTIHMFFDMENVEELDLDSGSSDSIDAGNTISSATDPDDYIDASSVESVGRHTLQTAALATAVLSADCHYAVRLTGDKLADGTADAIGKIAYKIGFVRPAKFALERAKAKVYTHH